MSTRHQNRQMKHNLATGVSNFLHRKVTLSSKKSPATPENSRRGSDQIDALNGGFMARGWIWVTAEDMARNRGRVLSTYRQILRCLNNPDLPLSWAARLQKKAEVRGIFLLGAEQESRHNIEDLLDTADYAISLLRRGEIPKLPM